MPRSDDYDPAVELSRLSYQSGFYDAIQAEQEEHVTANRTLQDAVVEASHRPEIAGLWNDQGWEDTAEMLIPAGEDGGEYVDLGEDGGEYDLVEEWE